MLKNQSAAATARATQAEATSEMWKKMAADEEEKSRKAIAAANAKKAAHEAEIEAERLQRIATQNAILAKI